jgi:hypothetical protein
VEFAVDDLPADYAPRYNIAPTQEVLAIVTSKEGKLQYERAIDLLQQLMYIARVRAVGEGRETYNYTYDLFVRRYPEAVRAAERLNSADARVAVLEEQHPGDRADHDRSVDHEHKRPQHRQDHHHRQPSRADHDHECHQRCGRGGTSATRHGLHSVSPLAPELAPDGQGRGDIRRDGD